MLNFYYFKFSKIIFNITYHILNIIISKVEYYISIMSYEAYLIFIKLYIIFTLILSYILIFCYTTIIIYFSFIMYILENSIILQSLMSCMGLILCISYTYNYISYYNESSIYRKILIYIYYILLPKKENILFNILFALTFFILLTIVYITLDFITPSFYDSNLLNRYNNYKPHVIIINFTITYIIRHLLIIKLFNLEQGFFRFSVNLCNKVNKLLVYQCPCSAGEERVSCPL